MTCSDTDNDGFTAPPNTPVTIDVLSGASVGGSGINVSGTGDSFVDNDGTISGPSAVTFNGVAGFSKTLNNNGTLNAGIVGSGDGIIVINHNGVINSGGITITGAGENRLNIFAGRTVNGLADITGTRNFVDSQGTFNAGLTMTGTESNSVIIREGGAVSGTFSHRPAQLHRQFRHVQQRHHADRRRVESCRQPPNRGDAGCHQQRFGARLLLQ